MFNRILQCFDANTNDGLKRIVSFPDPPDSTPLFLNSPINLSLNSVDSQSIAQNVPTPLSFLIFWIFFC